MPAGRVLATQQARDAAKQMLAITGPLKEQVRSVLQHGGLLADPNHWNGGLAGKWRNDWGTDANHLRQAAAKLDELEYRAQQVVDDIFKADGSVLRAANGLGLPLSNLDGEQSGGINPSLPTDLPTLQKALDAARAAGTDPQQYAALLQQYWLVKAATEAGIDLKTWDPSTGVGGNLQNITNVYKLYGKLFLDHPELQWAGMANMIGPSFAGGFMDLDSMKKLTEGLAHVINSLPPGLRNALPPELSNLVAVGAQLTADELSWFENKFLAMQKHIFIDMASQHEAYLNGGTAAIDEMRRAGLIDNRAQNAWNDIASGDPYRIQHGNTDLLYREQNQVIAKQYDQMYQHDGPVGPVMTYLMSVVGAASIPGTKTPGEYHPLNVGGDVTIPGLLVDETVGAHLKTPLPDFDIADRDARWDYITHDTLPAYQKLLHEHPEQASQIVASPVEDRISQQRLAHRWPKLADELLTGWHLGVDARLRFHWPWS
ncbi:MAG: hypothetical protein QOJ20_3061 [Mycobacterium sp.]|nr:hypothetical protein [Mycobacterium sp.]